MKPWALSTALALCVLGSAPAVRAADGAIELFWIPEGSGEVAYGSCQGTSHYVPGLFARIQISVQAHLAGLTAPGISAAALYVEGPESLPQGSVHVAEPNPGAAVTLGNPLAPHESDGATFRRAAVAWSADPSDCQIGTLVENSRYVQLYTLTLLRVGQDLPQDLRLRVVAGDPAVFPGLDCPALTLCDSPTFTAVCVSGGDFIVNPVQQSCKMASGTTAIEQVTWGKVKNLYRDVQR